jgi:hypothetical protein
MTASARTSDLGRYVYGAAGLAFGLTTLIWHNYKDWDQLRYILTPSDGPIFLYAAVAAQIFGGIAILFRRSASIGAIVLGAVYLVFALLAVPPIVTAPRIYNNWGNFFEQFSLLTGAALIYARSPGIGRIALGLCSASFALEQAIYLNNTMTLVPKWLPPSQKFWAIATTMPFALAAVALLTNRTALLATRLLTVMLASFGVLVWIPLLISDPRSHGNWSETIETFAIAGTAWVLADLLRRV